MNASAPIRKFRSPMGDVMLRVWMRRFPRDRRGNVAMIFALSIIPIMFFAGMGLDFAAATQKRVKLNAAADSAALAAVAPGMMSQSDASAITAAQNMFTAQAAAVPQLNINGSQPTVTVTHTGLARNVNVSYTANSVNAFPNVLGLLNGGTAQQYWPISGSSQASSSIPPDINFYLLLDNSPSMALAATTDGINTMNSNTTAQGGCAFGCHETNPTSSDVAGNPFVSGNSGPRIDNYTLAQSLGVVLRIQNVASATSALMTAAKDYQTTNSAYNVAYNMAIFTFANNGIDPVFPAGCTTSSCTPSNNLSAAGTAASGIDVIVVCSNNYLGPYQNGACTNDNSDEDTEFDTAMSQMNTLMPNPGTGLANSTPQEVLFIVTDGVEDKKLSDTWQTICKETETGSRCQQEFDTQLCTTIKNRGIFIAILYTVYEPLPATGNGSNSWYNSYVAPYQTKIGPNLQSCASPGLYFAVTTDQDITSAMSALFKASVNTARLTQ
ncbi:MAG: pilus assembly protein TadG-related protein [Xanthobacteraceae bacterium]|jgi:Flp pilus assembly protein TadG